MGKLTAVLSSRSAERVGPIVTASVLLTDESDNVLLVRSRDSKLWAIPSSVVASNDEAPHDCVERLMSQQLGLTAVAGRLLVVSWTPAENTENRAVVNFLFDGGAVHNKIAMFAGTGASNVFRFFTWEQAETEVSAKLAQWLDSARNVREAGGAAYVPDLAV
jgi:ADP-ribose pyrophosphatase YjhB (NUDIX family)